MDGSWMIGEKVVHRHAHSHHRLAGGIPTRLLIHLRFRYDVDESQSLALSPRLLVSCTKRHVVLCAHLRLFRDRLHV